MHVNKLLEEQSQEAVKREESTSLLSEMDSKVYIDQDVFTVDYEDYANPKRLGKSKAVNIFEEIEKNRVLTIEAQMGGGKTKLLNKIVSHYSDRDTFMEKRIAPIYLHSNHLASGEFEGLDSFTSKIEKGYGIEKVEKDTYLLLIDGLDESSFQNENDSDYIGELIEQAKLRKDVKLVFCNQKDW